MNAAKTTLALGVASAIFDQIGPKIAGDYFALIWWGIVVLSLAVASFFAWRFYVGVQSGRLLFDDVED